MDIRRREEEEEELKRQKEEEEEERRRLKEQEELQRRIDANSEITNYLRSINIKRIEAAKVRVKIWEEEKAKRRNEVICLNMYLII